MSHQSQSDQGLTGRAYARHAGVAAATVQRWKADGWLVLLADGSIDKAASDARVAELRQAAKAKAAARPLARARERKLAAEVADLEDELAATRAQLIPADDAARARRMVFAFSARGLLGIAPAAAPLVAGQPARAAKEQLTDVINETLTRLSETEFSPDPDSVAADDPPTGNAVREEPPPAAVVDLAARKAQLHAERIELRRAVRRGALLESAPYVRDLQSKLGPARARVLGLPTRLAPRFIGQDAGAAEREIREVIIGEVLPLLCGPLPGCGDLTVADLLEVEEGTT
ncbi:MAG: hypothetical protein ACFCUW_02300 [Kiloniellaceae bacterium]